MNRKFILAAALLFVFSTPATLISQSEKQEAKPTPETVKQSKAALDAEAEQRLTTAMALLTALADDAKSFKDNKLRARVLAQAADAFEEANRAQATSLFRRAWNEAEIADKAAAEKAVENSKGQGGGNGEARV